MCLMLFVVVGVMETIYYAFVPSFTSMHAAVLRSEEVVSKKIAWGFFKQYGVVMETCNRHRNDIIGIHTCALPLRSVKEKCLRLYVVKKQTCIVVIFCWLLNALGIQTFVHIALTVSYTDTCKPIIMYCLGLFAVAYSKQCCLQKWLQSLLVTSILIMFFRFWVSYVSSIRRSRRRRWTTLPIIAP